MIEGNLKDWLDAELYRAYLDARKSKRRTSDEHRFELNVFSNLRQLREDIISRYYAPGRSIAFIIHDPVMREIFAAPFRDRVVHHFLFNMVYDWWDKRLIYDSYSCRKGKGTLFGIKRLQAQMRQASRNYTQETMVVKLDLQGYFMSLPRRKVYERIRWGLERQFANDERLMQLLDFLWRQVIFDDPTRGARIKGRRSDWVGLPDSKSLFKQPIGQGIVIGNLSSQLISNIYLDQLDRYVRYELGYKHYGRYVDDFYILVAANQMERMREDIERIRSYLFSIGLVLHPKKRYIQNIRKGVEFLGVVVYPHCLAPSVRLRRGLRQAVELYLRGEGDEEKLISYLGHLRHYNSDKVIAKSLAVLGMEGV